jgi:membrane protease YdiL (CAAX protease family)
MSAKSSVSRRIAYAFGLTAWVVFALVVGQTLAGLAVYGALPESLNATMLGTISAAVGYVFALALAIGVPALIWKKRASNTVLGLDRWPSWSDIGFGLLAVLPYYMLSAAVVWLGMDILKIIDPNVGQQIGFENLTMRIELILAFVTLVVMAPLAEEILFRGYFLGRMNENTGKWAAVLITSVAFGLMHLVGVNESGSIVLQWGAATDTFAMGLTAGVLRTLTGSIWAGVLLHGLKNSVAYYFLFIDPLLTGGM